MSERRPDDPLPLEPGKRLEDDVEMELEHHLEMRVAELVSQGMEPAAARAAAVSAFGDVMRVKDECTDVERTRRRTRRRAERWDALRQDLLVGMRMLVRSPGFTITAVVTLALGIGANTAIFSVVNGVLLRPLPYAEPERLVTLLERHENGWANVPWSNFVDFREYSQSFAGLASYGSGTVTVLGADEPVRVTGASVSADFFRVMAVQPVVGRIPRSEEHVVGAMPVAVVSHTFWRNHLGSRPLAGLRVRTSFDMEVVGVMPPGFDYPNGTAIWRPLELQQQSLSRTSHNWDVIGRLRPGVGAEDAQRELDRLVERLSPLYQPDFDATGAIVTQLQARLTDSMRRPLYILLGASALLLLAACTNLASAILARGTARGQEFAVRAALGAGRLRLVRQFFTETLLLAALGCAAGIILAQLLLRVLVTVTPPRLRLEGVSLDGWVLGFAVLVALGTAVLFGFFPALRVTDTDVAQTMRDGARGSAGPGRQRLWSALVGAEVALAVVLLAGSVLLIRSFAAVMATDPGFRSDSVMTIEVNLPTVEYPEVERAALFHEQALAAIAAVPGVRAAGATNVLPLQGTFPNGALQVEGKPFFSPERPFTGFAIYRLAGQGYFRAMGIPVLRGRDFGLGDHAGAQEVVIVNQAFADREWPGEDPIGKRMRPAGMDMGRLAVPTPDGDLNPERWATVVGVVGNVSHGAVTSAAGTGGEAYYYDYRQRPLRSRSMTYAVHAGVPLASLTRPITEAVRSVDRNVPLQFTSLREVVGSSVADRRFTVLVLGAFAIVAVLLAGVGIYGVVAYSVAQRTREIGIRLALGASPAVVRWRVQADALRVVAVGLVAGAAAALLLTRLLRSMLYEVSASDPVAFGAAIVLLLAVGWLASLIPAVRGTRVDPMIAIRAE